MKAINEAKDAKRRRGRRRNNYNKIDSQNLLHKLNENSIEQN